MKLKYLGLISLLFTTCLVACTQDITTSSSSNTNTSSIHQHEIEEDEVYEIFMEEGSPLESNAQIVLEGSVEDKLEEGKYYLGSTYTFTFSFADINGDKKYVNIDDSYLVYDDEYLKVTNLAYSGLYDIDNLPIQIYGKPTYYIKMLKAVENTSFSIVLQHTSYTIDFNIIEIDENVDIYKHIAVDEGNTSEEMPGYIKFLNSVNDVEDNFWIANYITSNQRDEAFFEKNSYLAIYIKTYYYSYYNYDTTFISSNGNLIIRFLAKLPSQLNDVTWNYYNQSFFYLFRIGKDFIDMDISILFNSEFDRSIFKTGG